MTIAAMFKDGDKILLDKLIQLPCLFMQECFGDQIAHLGRIIRARVAGNEVSIRFVVADYTGQANGVYFEAGFALGLGLTVIPTCRADEVPKLHFDIRHLNTLAWTKPADLALKLS